MKNALITIALAGLAMRPENVLAGGSMSMCDATKITAECSFISSSTDCSADANCEWKGSSCDVSSSLVAGLMPTSEDFAATISIGLTCGVASPCTGDCETRSDGTCIGTKAYYKSLFTDDAMPWQSTCILRENAVLPDNLIASLSQTANGMRLKL